MLLEKPDYWQGPEGKKLELSLRSHGDKADVSEK
jgi:hypothetical protein